MSMPPSLRERVRRQSDGFSLVELLVVVGIVGALAAIAIPVYANQRERAFRAAVQSDLYGLAIHAESYFADARTYEGFADSEEYEDFDTSPGVVVDEANSSFEATEYCMEATHDALDLPWSYRPETGPVEEPCPEA